ncbi:PREDICTED: uncharacterized protein LOC108745442 isoform X1 [Trachymyrmex septentrionalis]|uniref:uncharacterized protein LOC108745442 isoform X1 n=1 Tax=Trachymyrmex septentrionalis TaxID=34720 RepID=UPI00084F29AA|nr:PREDICTED: uncharacterized protein LOC108745442 isoform X1 [Trachymyrmex septentrionalis]
MKNDLSLGSIMFFVIVLFVLFVYISDAKPIDYEDVANLLPTEPQTTNDTLAAVVRDPVVQDAVQNTIGNRSLEGLVIKKKVLVMPATEPTKVVSQSEQILVVPMANLEDVRKNITETVNAKTDVDDLISTDVQFFTENGENGYINSESKHFSSYASQHDDLNEASTETFKSTRKPFLIDNIPQEIPYLMSNPSQEIMPLEHPPLTISVPIIAFLESAKISDDKIDVPILPMQDEILKTQLENSYDGVQQNVPNYDESSWSVGPNNWRLDLSSSEMGVSPSLYESNTKQIKYMNDINSENSLPAKMSRVDITPLFWTSDADINYPKDPHDMEVAANMVFRPFFKYRQEVQRRSYRNPAYRRYNSYNSYPRRNYQYRP